MRFSPSRLIAWLVAVILALIFIIFIGLSCVSVRVQTGTENTQDKEQDQTGIESTVNRDTL